METKETTQLGFFFVTAKGGNQVLTLDKNKCFDFNLPFLILDHFSKSFEKLLFLHQLGFVFFLYVFLEVLC